MLCNCELTYYNLIRLKLKIGSLFFGWFVSVSHEKINLFFTVLFSALSWFAIVACTSNYAFGIDHETAMKNGGYAIAAVCCLFVIAALLSGISRVCAKQKYEKFICSILDAGVVLAEINPIVHLVEYTFDFLEMPIRAFKDGKARETTI